MRRASEKKRLHITARGFTLLEIMLAMFVLSLMLAGVFAIVGGTTQLADEVERAHDRDAQAHSFAQFCERTLRGLPGTSQVRLRLKKSGNHYLSELALKDAPSPIGIGGGEGLLILQSEEMPDGYLRLVLKTLTSEEAAAAELGRGDVGGTRLVLLEGVAKCDWRFFNPRSNEWETVWNENLQFTWQNLTSQPPPTDTAQLQIGARFDFSGGSITANSSVTNFINPPRPGLVELVLGIGGDAPRRFVFWVPPAQPPLSQPGINPAVLGLPGAGNPNGANPNAPPPVNPVPGTGPLPPR